MVNIIFHDTERYDEFKSGYFTLNVIKTATQNFSSANVIHRNWFGDSIYKGVLPNGVPIAIKLISTKTEGFMEKRSVCLNEIDSILSLQHTNVIRLLGHYSDDLNLVLIYEHMEYGDLKRALFGDLKERLDWKTRFQICLGIAKGLAFLHLKDDSKCTTVHRDIRPGNILLDDNFNPKITGLGKARHFGGDDTHYSTLAYGTIGYIDPEYCSSYSITDKTDVYSFGILLLVIMSGKGPIFKEEGFAKQNLRLLAYELQEKGDLLTLVDEDLKPSISVYLASMVLNLAILCTNITAKLRPTMSEVVNILEGRINVKFPGIDPSFLTKLSTDAVDISNIGRISKETEPTDQGSDFNDKNGGDATLSSKVALKVAQENGNLELRQTESLINLRSIELATNNFSPANKIGQGSSGSVYKGMLPNGTAIAVKQLFTKSGHGKLDFLNELNTISTLKHPNLVRLLGHSTENDQQCLIYEYVENGSLYSVLFDNVDAKLTWAARVRICIGVAKGLSFLHDDDSKAKIVHRDIKLSNILLDKELVPKISDFGLVMHYNREITHINTGLAGTIGYMAPEYVIRGTVTEKIDVYSFGIVTLELISGKKKVEWISNHENLSLLDTAYAIQTKGDVLEFIDQDLKMSISVEEAELMFNLAMLCTNPEPKSRPTMSEVVSILEGRTKLKTNPCNLHDKTTIDSTINFPDISVHNLHGHVVSEPAISNNRMQASSVYVDTPGEYKRTLEYVEPFFTEEGKLQIVCSDEEFEAGCNEWKNSLVGFFVGEKVCSNVGIKMFEMLWEVKGDFSVFTLDNGYFIFQFSCAEDKVRVLESADLWKIQQRQLILREWDRKMKFNQLDQMESIPIWVKIYNLPVFLWTSSFLSKIGSGLGIPMYVDQKTKSRERLAYAMLCIEVNAHKQLPDSLNVIVKGMEYKLDFDYDSSQMAALLALYM